MGVMGYPFIFNGIESERFNASIVFIDDTGVKKPSGGNKQFVTEYIHGNSKAILLDVNQTEPLSFNIEIAFENPVDAYTLSAVKNWLCSPMKFSKLYICTKELENFYYNCYINITNDMIFNGGYRAISGVVTCDSPFMWENQLSTRLEPNVKTIFVNKSHDARPMKPIIQFKSTSDNENMIVIEDVVRDSGRIVYDRTFIFASKDFSEFSYTQKDGRIVKFKPLFGAKAFSENEIVTLDNQFAIIESSRNQIGLSNNFNKTFLKIPLGINELYVGAVNINDIKLIYSNARRIGGGWY